MLQLSLRKFMYVLAFSGIGVVTFLASPTPAAAADPLRVFPPCNFVHSADTMNGARKHIPDNGYAVDIAGNNGIPNADPKLTCSGLEAYASIDGTVTTGTDSYGGKYLDIKGDGGVMVRGVHFSSYQVSNGQRVTAGQRVATIGHTGNVTGNFDHIHYEVFKDGVRQPYAKWKWIEYPKTKPNFTVPCRNNYCPVYRFYNRITDDHFFTSSNAERNTYAQNPTWKLEGLAFYKPGVPYAGLVGIYRARHKVAGSYFYGVQAEVQAAVNSGAYEMQGYVFDAYAASNSSSLPVYRLYNPGLQQHMYTISTVERNALVNAGWQNEGIKFHMVKNDTCYNNVCPTFRMWNVVTQKHLYSRNLTGEIMPVLEADPNWTFETTAYYVHKAQATGSVAVYRYRNSSTGAYFFSTSGSAKTSPWVKEGIAFYAYTTSSSVTGLKNVREFYNSTTKGYFYTTDANFSAPGWVFQRNAFKAKSGY